MNIIRLLFLIFFASISVSATATNGDNRLENNDEACQSENRYNEPMTFCSATNGGNAADSEWISAEGEITADTPSQFLKWLDEESISSQMRVYFNSPGGNILGGLRLGSIIRDRSFNTGIQATIPVPDWEDNFIAYEELNSGQCYSACAYAFLGGVERSYFDDDTYGVHQFYDPRILDLIENPETPVATYGNLVDAQILTSFIASYVEEMGVSSRLVVLAAATSPIVGNGIRLLTVAEAKEFDVINTKSNEPFELMQIDGVLTAQSIGYYLNRPILRQVQCLDNSMVVYVWTPSGATVENWNGANLEIDLGNFTRVGTFQILGPTIYENEPHTIYALRIPVNENEWTDIRGVGFLELWPFSRANKGVSNAFEMGFGNPQVLSLIGRNCVASDSASDESDQSPSDGGDQTRAEYLSRLHAQLVQSRRYPLSARREGLEGVVQIGLTIDRDGLVTEFRITRGSGFDILDEEVRNMIVRVQPLTSMPDSMEISQITINMAIRFKLD